MLKAYSILMFFKTDSLHILEYTVNANNVPQFVHKEINGRIGCDIPNSIQLINNIPVFSNTSDGVFVVVSTALYEEKNVLPISININKNLLSEPSLKNAISVDYDGKYWLCVNGNVYLYDYTYSPYYAGNDIFTAQRKVAWYKWSGITPSCFESYNDTLIFANASDNSIVAFNPSKWYDFDETNIISAGWQSKAFNFGSHTQLKNITALWIVANTQRSTSFTVEYLDELGNTLDSIVCDKDVFSWSNFNWSSFVWNISRFATDFYKRPRIRRVRYFSIRITNNSPYQDVAISNIKVQAELLDNDRRR